MALAEAETSPGAADAVAAAPPAPSETISRAAAPGVSPLRPPARKRRLGPPDISPLRPPARKRRLGPPDLAPLRPPARKRRLGPPDLAAPAAALGRRSRTRRGGVPRARPRGAPAASSGLERRYEAYHRDKKAVGAAPDGAARPRLQNPTDAPRRSARRFQTMRTAGSGTRRPAADAPRRRTRPGPARPRRVRCRVTTLFLSKSRYPPKNPGAPPRRTRESNGVSPRVLRLLLLASWNVETRVLCLPLECPSLFGLFGGCGASLVSPGGLLRLVLSTYLSTQPRAHVLRDV